MGLWMSAEETQLNLVQREVCFWIPSWGSELDLQVQKWSESLEPVLTAHLTGRGLLWLEASPGNSRQWHGRLRAGEITASILDAEDLLHWSDVPRGLGLELSRDVKDDWGQPVGCELLIHHAEIRDSPLDLWRLLSSIGELCCPRYQLASARTLGLPHSLTCTGAVLLRFWALIWTWTELKEPTLWSVQFSLLGLGQASFQNQHCWCSMELSGRELALLVQVLRSHLQHCKCTPPSPQNRKDRTKPKPNQNQYDLLFFFPLWVPVTVIMYPSLSFLLCNITTTVTSFSGFPLGRESQKISSSMPGFWHHLT